MRKTSSGRVWVQCSHTEVTGTAQVVWMEVRSLSESMSESMPGKFLSLVHFRWMLRTRSAMVHLSYLGKMGFTIGQVEEGVRAPEQYTHWRPRPGGVSPRPRCEALPGAGSEPHITLAGGHQALMPGMWWVQGSCVCVCFNRVILEQSANCCGD